jgi:four helix bundle protein
VLIYEFTKTLPADERYGLVQQLRRAVISIIANIAEGSKRVSEKDRAHFFVMADASLEEVKCYCIVSVDLGYSTLETSERLLEQARKVGRMLSGLIRSVRVERPTA